MWALLLISAVLLGLTDGFSHGFHFPIHSFGASVKQSARTAVLGSQTTLPSSHMPHFALRLRPLNARKKEIFSDDLFDEEPEEPTEASEARTAREAKTRGYLEEKWALSEQDAKEFEGFPWQPKENQLSDAGPLPKLACFALLYKFREEYSTTGFESALADHNGMCIEPTSPFKRLISTEMLDTEDGRGVVLIWTGRVEGEAEYASTREEITKFLDEDPLIAQEIVETWDLIDLTPGKEQPGGDDAESALPAGALAGSA